MEAACTRAGVSEMHSVAMSLFAERDAVVAKLQQHLKDLESQKSNTEIAINDITHVIEYLNLPADKMAMIVKSLKTLLVQRRNLKEQVILLNNVLSYKKDPATELNASVVRQSKYLKEAEAAYQKILKT